MEIAIIYMILVLMEILKVYCEALNFLFLE